MRKILSYLLIIPIPFFSFSQEILWEKSYGGIHSEYLFDAQPTADYGFILAGSSLSGKTGNKQQENVKDLDYWLWKMDEKGDLDFQKNFGGNGNDLLKSIQITIDGGFIMAGTSNSMRSGQKAEDSFGQEDFWIIKLNAMGDEEWQKTIGGSGSDNLTSINQTKDGGYIIGGTSSSANNSIKEEAFGSTDYWIVKLSASGTIEWEKTFGGQFKEILESMTPTKDEGYLIGGWSNSNVSGNKSEESNGMGDYWILKLDKIGNIQWQQSIGGEKDDHLATIIETKDNGFILGGNSVSGISGTKTKANGKGTDFWIVKLSETGALQWEETYDFGKTDILTSITENTDGSYLIGGYANTETTGLKSSDKEGIDDYIALKINEKGEEKWKRTIGSTGSDNLKKLVQTRDEGYLLIGTSNGKATRDKNTGNGRSDFWVVKLLDEDKKKEAGRFIGLEAFPNPTEAFTNIIVNHEFERGTAYLYDIQGKVIQHFPVERQTIPFDIRGLPIGMYIVTIETDVKTESIKILKSK